MWFLPGGAWFFPGGVCVGYDERAVRILLECILVLQSNCELTSFHGYWKLPQ